MPAPTGAGAVPPGDGMMATPQPHEGDQMHAEINVKMAVEILENQLPIFGSSSEKGQALLSAIKALSTKFGQTDGQAKEMIPAEIMQMLSALPQGGTGNPGAAPPPPGPAPGMPPMAAAA